MQEFLRICGGIGLFVGVVVILACCYVAIRIDVAVCKLTDQATDAIEAVRVRVTDANAQMKKLNQMIGQAIDKQAEELDPQGLAATRKFQEGILEIRQRVDQVSTALEKTLAIVDILQSLGLEMDGHRITKTLEKTEEIDDRLEEFSANFSEITERFRPDGTLREAVADEVKERTLVAVEKVLFPTGILIDELNQVAEGAQDLVSQIRSRLRWTIFWVTSVIVLIAAWMTLGQLALLRNGLLRSDSTG